MSVYSLRTPLRRMGMAQSMNPQLQGLSIKKAVNWVKKHKREVIAGVAIVGAGYLASRAAGGWKNLLTKDGWKKVWVAAKGIPGKFLPNNVDKAGKVTGSVNWGKTFGGAVGLATSVVGVLGAGQGGSTSADDVGMPPSRYADAVAAETGGGIAPYTSIPAGRDGLSFPPGSYDPNTGLVRGSDGVMGKTVDVTDSMPDSPSSTTPGWVWPVVAGVGGLIVLLAVAAKNQGGK